MTVHLDILVEVEVIIVKFLSIQNKRIIKNKKRLIFISDIQSIEEGLYLNRNKTDYNDCINIIMNSGEIIRTSESYSELMECIINLWKKEQELIKNGQLEEE